MSIDTSRVFDTIKRKVILNLLNDAWCSNDDIILVAFLMSNTKLRIKLSLTKSELFQISLGSGQWYSLSGKLFELYLAGALNHLRAVSNRSNPPISANMIPLEVEYVDNCNFLDESEDNLKLLLPKMEDIFAEWNLKVNPSKTEFTHFIISENKEERGEEK